MTLRAAPVLALLATVAFATVAAAPAGPPGVGRDQTIAAQPKAKTIAELVKRYDSSSCVECHAEAHEQWARSVHARSIFGMTGRTAATFGTTVKNGLMSWSHSGVKDVKDVKVEHMMGCAKCHLPQLSEANDSVVQELLGTLHAWQSALEEGEDDKAAAAEKTLTSLNINCLVCHNRNAITHKWADGYPRKDTVYGVAASGEHPDPKLPRVARSGVMPESILCGQCHGLGPNLELDEPTQCATLYGSYLFAYIPEGGGKTCQQCHMRDSKLGHDIQSYRSPVMAKQAVDMHVEAAAVSWRDNRTVRPKIRVRVDLDNRSGHGIPDG